HAHRILDGFVFVHGCSKIAPTLIVPELPAWNVPGSGLWIRGGRPSRGLLGVIEGILHKKQLIFGKRMLQVDAFPHPVYERVVASCKGVQPEIPDDQSSRTQRS